MSLPILAGPEDVKAIVAYLKTKPAGATITEARAAVKKQVIDGRKLAAYQAWDIVAREADRIKLTQRGWDLARGRKTEQQTVREVIDSIVPYHSALEWIFHQGFDSVTNVDIASHWHEHHSEALGTDSENTAKDQAVCFMKMCEAAGFGQFTIGRRGQATRLVVDTPMLKAHIEAGPTAPPWTEPGSPAAPATGELAGEAKEAGETRTSAAVELHKPVSTTEQSLRVFISHGKNQAIVEQVETMLGLADIEAEVAEKEETSAIPVPDKVFSAMRRCAAGIIIVSADEGNKDGEDRYRINENVLIEIGAAFVLYDRRVVLLWDKRLPIPSNLQGLYRCEYEGDDLSWGAGMKLMKAIRGFKKP